MNTNVFKTVMIICILAFPMVPTLTVEAREVETETIFMPINFGPGNTVVFHFENKGPTAQDLLIQRFSADGTLLDTLVRGAAAETTTEFRMDVLSPEPLESLNTDFSLRISFVTPGMPAYRAGLRKDDILVKINGQTVTKTAQVRTLIQDSKGQALDVVYKRNNITRVASVIPELNNGTLWVIGIASLGWVRVMEEGKAVVVSATYESLRGNKLEQYTITHGTPQFTKEYTFDNTTSLCGSVTAKSFKCNGVQSIFFINMSDKPVELGTCIDEPGCTPATTETVVARAMIFYPNQPQHTTIATLIPGYSVAGIVSLGEGSIQTFDASSSITFGPESQAIKKTNK